MTRTRCNRQRSWSNTALPVLLLVACVQQPARVLTAPAPSIPAGSAAAADYEFTRLDVPGAELTVASGINSSGHVVGWFRRGDSVQAFVQRNGEFAPISFPGALLTQAHGIGEAGEIVGWYRRAGEDSVAYHGFLLTPGDGFLDVTYPGRKHTIIQRILPDGTMLGCYHDDDFGASMRGMYVGPRGASATTAFGSMHNGATADLRRIAGLYHDTTANRTRGYIIEDGRFRAFDAPGSAGTEAWDMNESGVVVGHFSDSTGARAGFVLVDDRFTILRVPDSRVTVALGINARGDVVGGYMDAAGRRRAFVARRRPAVASD